MKTVTLNPTWKAAARICLECVKHGADGEAQRNAESEIMRMADALDKLQGEKVGVYTRAFAKRIEDATSHIDFIGNDGKPRVRNYEDEARWYVAVHLAEDMRTDHTTKDWAHFVMEGMQPLNDQDIYEFFYPEDGEPGECGMPTREELIRWFHG